MRKDIVPQIVQVSKKLFNERGYSAVSTQDIADAVGISKGNLSYHFKRKEDIIGAVVEEMHTHYVKPKPPATLEELNVLFRRVQKVAIENAFYFWDYTQLAQTSDMIRNIQNTVMGDTYTLFSGAFKLLKENGSLQNEEYPSQYEQLVRAIMLICIYWTPHSRLEANIGTKGGFLDCIWGIIYPLLTDKGKIQYRDLWSKPLTYYDSEG